MTIIDENSISEEMKNARQNVSSFCTALILDIDDCVNVDVKVGLMREVFAALSLLLYLNS